MKYTDIQLKDKATWRSYKQQWADNNFEVVTETELEDKKLNAALLNDVTDSITSLQGGLLIGAETLKTNKIPCQENVPTLESGQIWFDIYDSEETGNYIKFTSKDGEFSISANFSWDGAIDFNFYPWLPDRWGAWDGSSLTARQDPDTGEYTILLRGYRNSIITGNDGNNAWKITADSSVKVECHGNMENLLHYVVVQQGGHPTMGDYAFANMFKGCTQLTVAPELPFMALSKYCYYSMFYGCTNLRTAPELPGTALNDHCYEYMFRYCTSLITPPELPATTLKPSCYVSMFDNCKYLSIAPELPALILASNCYANMFTGCERLVQPPTLPADTLTLGCYSGMFMGCTNLKSAPELNALGMMPGCYSGMFWGCSSITEAPKLPAILLSDTCYERMFMECTNLELPPELPATTLASRCYQGMFRGCAGIKLSETQTSSYSTPYRIPSSGTGVDATNSLTDMFANTGGTFTGTPTINTTYYTKGAYIHFSTESGDLTINVKSPGWDGTLEYSMDGEEWVKWNGSNITSADGSIYFRGSNNSIITGYPSRSGTWNIFGNRVSCTGNIETLLDYGVVENGEHPAMGQYCYDSMFRECSDLIEAPFLPATELGAYCYFEMFYGCTSLTKAPELPAVDAVCECCYCGMFSGCISLTSAPALPAEIVSSSAYYKMFLGCTNLVTAPSLPATTLGKDCYRGMFSGCINLTFVPSLPSTELKEGCYTEMFKGCTKIKLSTTQTGEYTQPYRIPTAGEGEDFMGGRAFMFTNTGGTFTNDPQINTTYYLSSSNTIV